MYIDNLDKKNFVVLKQHIKRGHRAEINPEFDRGKLTNVYVKKSGLGYTNTEKLTPQSYEVGFAEKFPDVGVPADEVNIKELSTSDLRLIPQNNKFIYLQYDKIEYTDGNGWFEGQIDERTMKRTLKWPFSRSMRTLTLII